MSNSSRPKMIANFAVTYRCNSRCTTCNIWASPDRKREELTLSEIAEFFEEEHKFLSDVRMIQLTGGEPYLRKDLSAITNAIWRGVPKAFIWIATNGLLPDTIAETTFEILNELRHGGLGVTISLDGVGATHDSQRGVPNAYQKSMQTIRLLSALRKVYPLRLSVGMTITPGNQYQIAQAVAQAELLNVDISVRPMNVSDAYYRNSPAVGKWDPIAISAGLRSVADHQVIHKGPFGAAPVISYLRGIQEYINGKPRPLPCSAGSSSLYLDPYGAVYPCLFVDKKIGEIRDTRLRELWRSKEAREIRDMIASGLCPGCYVECETMRDIRKDRRGLFSATLSGLGYFLSLSPSSL